MVGTSCKTTVITFGGDSFHFSLFVTSWKQHLTYILGDPGAVSWVGKKGRKRFQLTDCPWIREEASLCQALR